jgi:hypothetical protein
MIATIIRVILGGLWKPIAAVLGALGLYVKARADQRRADEIKDAKETIEAHEVRNDVEDRIARGGSAKQRLRERWSK